MESIYGYLHLQSFSDNAHNLSPDDVLFLYIVKVVDLNMAAEISTCAENYTFNTASLAMPSRYKIYYHNTNLIDERVCSQYVDTTKRIILMFV